MRTLSRVGEKAGKPALPRDLAGWTSPAGAGLAHTNGSTDSIAPHKALVVATAIKDADDFDLLAEQSIHDHGPPLVGDDPYAGREIVTGAPLLWKINQSPATSLYGFDKGERAFAAVLSNELVDFEEISPGKRPNDQPICPGCELWRPSDALSEFRRTLAPPG